MLHFWDGENIAPEWFGDRGNIDLGTDFGGFFYDAYVLFGPKARWTRGPDDIVGWGATVIGASDQLKRELQPLLAKSAS